jgi:peptidoglycan/xylan/chitin deacetylase (PgdA/CDA1 family)
MKQSIILLITFCLFLSNKQRQENDSFIRINLLGYKPSSPKVAVWCSLQGNTIANFQLVEVLSGKIVFRGKAGQPFGEYGPFKQTYRLDFSSFKDGGKYFIQSGDAISPEFIISEDAYKGAADFCLRYMRQQRSGFNPFLKDSCHTHDGYTMYGPMPDSTHIDVSGGWHDASDYLQYSATSANAIYHLLAAYRDFPNMFGDKHQANGLSGYNGIADVLDEAKWGLDWLLKMHPRKDWMFNQLGDDRDHMGMRIPKEDSFYGKGFERPVYFCTGQPQGLFKYKNRATGTASTAGKFSTAFGLGYKMFEKINSKYALLLGDKCISAFEFGFKDTGVCQTAPGRAPYFYEEDNWSDDMELAATLIMDVQVKRNASEVGRLNARANDYIQMETVTPWLGADTAKHYQWYPFINAGHYELAKQSNTARRKLLMGYYKTGIEKVWGKARQNAFYRGVPFIWCSNNLTTSFAIQCYWYRMLTGDADYEAFEQANFDWLFGCNPWGTSFVYGLPSWADTPADPHSAFTHIKKYPIDGGLVDGPVYGSIYKKLIGITLYEPDEYATFQSDLVVYHDDYGDYSTNEPTMDGTASLIYLLAAKEAEQPPPPKKVFAYNHGAAIRGPSDEKRMSIVFTGDEYAEGAQTIQQALKKNGDKASFFFTGRFYRNPSFKKLIQQLKKDGHYLGPHSDQHLLYCDWNDRNKLLVTKRQFNDDLQNNHSEMANAGIDVLGESRFFLPPYEWYNDSIAAWTKELGLQLINYTPGTLSHADYTTPGTKNYRSGEEILNSIKLYEQKDAAGLNGFILLMHIGAGPQRKDKFYNNLDSLLKWLKQQGYKPVLINELLKN